MLEVSYFSIFKGHNFSKGGVELMQISKLFFSEEIFSVELLGVGLVAPERRNGRRESLFHHDDIHGSCVRPPKQSPATAHDVRA